MMLGEDFQPPPVVNVDWSEELLAMHINRERKTLFWVPGEYRIELCGL